MLIAKKLLVSLLVTLLVTLAGCDTGGPTSEKAASEGAATANSTATDTTASAAAAQVEPATLILTGGKVATVDQALGNHSAIALRGTTIAAVGSAEEMNCLLYTSPSPRDATLSRMPSSA